MSNRKGSDYYFTVQELMDRTCELAKQDARYPGTERACELDYQQVSALAGGHLLKRMDFDVVGTVVYGSSEGIYGNLYVRGDWLPDGEQAFHGSQMSVYTLKTLREDKEAYLAMGALVTLLSYYANRVVAENMDRFD